MAKSSFSSACDGAGAVSIAAKINANASAADAARRRSNAAMPAPSRATMIASIRNSASDDDSRMPRRSRGSELV